MIADRVWPSAAIDTAVVSEPDPILLQLIEARRQLAVYAARRARRRSHARGALTTAALGLVVAAEVRAGVRIQ